MALYVDVEDVSDRYEGILPGGAWVQTKVDDAERILLRRAPGLPDRITAGSVDVEDVKYAVAQAVLRVVRNPEGYTFESGGDYSYSRGAAAAAAAGEIVFRDSELAPLLAAPASTAWPGTVLTPLPPDRGGPWTSTGTLR